MMSASSLAVKADSRTTYPSVASVSSSRVESRSVGFDSTRCVPYARRRRGHKEASVPYPQPSARDVAFFAEHGWIAIEDAVDPDDLVTLEARCDVILEKKESMAFDWAWEDGATKDERAFKILQSSPTLFFPELNDERFRLWAVEFASALMGTPLEFWYDQFLAKPPGTSVPTRWHQDEGY